MCNQYHKDIIYKIERNFHDLKKYNLSTNIISLKYKYPLIIIKS